MTRIRSLLPHLARATAREWMGQAHGTVRKAPRLRRHRVLRRKSRCAPPLFSSDQMVAHGKPVLAAVTGSRRPTGPTALLARPRRPTRRACWKNARRASCATRSAKDRLVTPASEWPCSTACTPDRARRSAPRGASPPARLQPRAAAPGRGLRHHQTGTHAARSTTSRWKPSRTPTARLSRGTLSRFVARLPDRAAARRSASCWAFPIMLRLALLENLRRVAVRVAAGARRARPRRDLGLAHAAGGRGTAKRPDPDHRRHGALESEPEQRLRRGIRAPPAGPGRGARAAAHVDGAAPFRRQRDHRASRSCREPDTGCEPGLRGEQHRQPAPAGRDALARVRRDLEQRRADPARRPAGYLRPHGLRHARHLPPCGGEPGARGRRRRAVRGSQGDRARHRGAPAAAVRDERRHRRPRGPRRLLARSATGRPPSNRR